MASTRRSWIRNLFPLWMKQSGWMTISKSNTMAKSMFCMHCEKRSDRVTEAVNDIPGVSGVVNLKKGIVTVSY